MYDPISTIFYVAILSFKPVGSKLSIHDDTIIIQKPSIFQGLERWKTGAHRNELLQLSNPIIFFIQRYFDKKKTKKQLLCNVRNGVKKLIETYKVDVTDIVSESLKLYISYLESPEQLLNNKDLPKLDFNMVWNEKELNIGTNILDLCGKYRDQPKIMDHYIRILEEMLLLKNSMFQAYDIHTMIDEKDKKTLHLSDVSSSDEVDDEADVTM